VKRNKRLRRSQRAGDSVAGRSPRWSAWRSWPFIIQNRQDVKLDFLWWSFTWPLWIYTIVSALFGALVWFGVGVMRRRRRRKERRENRQD
jgi:hypothetical protein